MRKIYAGLFIVAFTLAFFVGITVNTKADTGTGKVYSDCTEYPIIAPEGYEEDYYGIVKICCIVTDYDTQTSYEECWIANKIYYA